QSAPEPLRIDRPRQRRDADPVAGADRRRKDHRAQETSVSRVLSPRRRSAGQRSFLWDRRCRRPRATYPEAAPNPLARTRRRDGRPAFRSPIWSCSAWGLPCLAPSPAERCALTAPFHPYPPRREGGLLSVALSVASPRLAVSEHAARWSSDFPPR